jgi:hypothetical protein
VAITIDDIKLIYPSDLSDAQYTQALDTANMVVNEDLRPNCSMSEARYDKITAYLGAHYASLIADYGSGETGPLKSAKMGQASETYVAGGDPEAYAYAKTPWGQAAISLDKCGILVGIGANRGVKALFRVVGGTLS